MLSCEFELGLTFCENVLRNKCSVNERSEMVGVQKFAEIMLLHSHLAS